MIKIGQKRQWGSGDKFEVVEERQGNIWIVKYENGRHDAHEGSVINYSSVII